ncbi:SDR family oxidoreductase [Sphingobacterium sp. N143]|uniref:SDR family oxidoreductase n=1 Tax=Sphingobacterium sp. N143 TaxID=2746727 RepID=UPI0025771BF8|nr:SDR family oxidoreductase [Sphingobacterium sp. N143]MDM1294637.1 SDR family oxidoreductase [Sphingobacterium sp. N143]
MEINLNGKKALIGASSAGIGAGIAKVLASCGVSVTLAARNEEKLKATCESLDTSRGQVHQYIQVDYNEHEAYKARIEDYFKSNKVDILINNSNGPQAGGIDQKNLADYQHAFELLFQNHCYTTSCALPYMLANGYGRIINVSSSTVKEPVSNLVLSNTVRTALMSWSKSLAEDVARDGITVNSILTGLFDTDRIQSLTKLDAQRLGLSYEEALKVRLKQVPAGRLGTAEEYGYLVAFICSEYANYLTGTNIPLDGGLLRGL